MAIQRSSLHSRRWCALARGAKQLERDLWHRDIAILGTASAHEMDAVITANGRDFLPFQDHVACTIHVVEQLPRRPAGR
jgi:hypothetical protein